MRMKWVSRWSAAALTLALAAMSTPQSVKAQAAYTLLTGGAANIDAQSFIGGPLSDDGTTLFFQTNESLSTFDVDTARDLYVASNGAITLLSGGVANVPATLRRMTRDGSRVFFITTERLDAADVDSAQDVYEASGGTITLISSGVAEIDADLPNPQGPPQTHVNQFGLSDDGSVVFFETTEAIPGTGDVDLGRDVYRASGGSVTLISGSTTPGSSAFAFFGFASADGSTVYFGTGDALVASDTDTMWDLYRASGGVFTMITPTAPRPTNIEGGKLIGAAANGSRVIFTTDERIIAGDGDFGLDCYVWERANGSYHSASGGADFATPTNGNECHDITADGSRIFVNAGDDLVPGDTNLNGDAYMYTTSSEALTALTSTPAGTFSGVNAISADGTRVVVGTTARLTADDTDSLGDTYVLSGGQFTLVTPGTTQFFSLARLSPDLTRAYFTTSQALDAADTDAQSDVYEGSAAGARLLTPGTTDGAFFLAVSADGEKVVISTTASLDAADADTATDYYEVEPVPADVDPPVVTLSIDSSDAVTGSGWYNSASSGANGVLVNVAASDPIGITNITALDGAAPVLNTANATGSFTLTDGQHSITANATDGLGNTGAAIGSTAMPIVVNVDQTAPTVVCTNPTVLLNSGSAPLSIASVTDTTSGPAANTLTISPGTSTVGLKTAPVTGSDLAGNQTTQSCNYRVVYAFTGFGAPLSVPPNDYVVAAVNKNIPMPFVLRDAQNVPVLGLNPRAVIETSFVNGSLCTGTATALPASSYPKGKSGLVEIGGGAYEYRYKAAKSAAGQCHRVSLNFGDGIQYPVVFRLIP